jgi:hypothetical protein
MQLKCLGCPVNRIVHRGGGGGGGHRRKNTEAKSKVPAGGLSQLRQRVPYTCFSLDSASEDEADKTETVFKGLSPDSEMA